MVTYIACLLILCGNSLVAFDKPEYEKWEGFRGLKWGTNVKDINDPNMFLVFTSEDKRITYYIRKDDKLSIGKAKLSFIRYFCYKDCFFSAVVVIRGRSNFASLKDAIFIYYGEGYQPNKSIKRWLWPRVYLKWLVLASLDYNELNEKTAFGMLYKPIYEQMVEDNKKDAEDTRTINRDTRTAGRRSATASYRRMLWRL